MDAFQALDSRRTVRQYQADYKIPKDILEKIVNVVLKSPTACNVQEIDLIVVTKKDLLTQIEKVALPSFPDKLQDSFNQRKSQLGVQNVITCDASCVIFLVKNSRADPTFTAIDTGIVSMAIMVAARDFGLDSMCLGCLLWGDKSKTEELIGANKGDLVMAVAIGKARSDHQEQPKEVLAKANYIE
ncbi:hypothetical protein M9Y10_011359 [Tritrichomonas musculus]|uniref:Nitroreductase domain-containing protein n=1 Tax=Tritrichomonas musculus TaxID=1915356 RepID=A0ABR2IJD4_9EUKA